MQISGQAANAPLYTHYHREMVQSVWNILLDDKFREAYCHGIVIKCADGVSRRIYLRTRIYSADYPEKYVLYCIQYHLHSFFLFFRMIMISLRDQGQYPWETPKELISELGMKRD